MASVCMVTCLSVIDGQLIAARVRWWARRRSMASLLMRLPVVVGKSGSVGAPARSAIQALRSARIAGTSGVRRSLRPLPMVWALAPVPRVMSGVPGGFRTGMGRVPGRKGWQWFGESILRSSRSRRFVG